jgi:hypothetical protein
MISSHWTTLFLRGTPNRRGAGGMGEVQSWPRRCARVDQGGPRKVDLWLKRPTKGREMAKEEWSGAKEEREGNTSLIRLEVSPRLWAEKEGQHSIRVRQVKLLLG